MIITLEQQLEQKKQRAEENLEAWKNRCQELENRLQAQSVLQLEISSQLHLDEGSSLQSQLLEEMKVESDQIQSELKELTYLIQESQMRKEQFMQHVQWVQNLKQQFCTGKYPPFY